VGSGLAVLTAVAVVGAGLSWALQMQSQASRGKPGAATAVATVIPAASSAATAASSAAVPAVPPASAASSVQPPAIPAAEPLQLADWTASDAAAWAALAQRWGLQLPPNEAKPCDAAALQGLQCYRSVSGSLSLIRLMDRPVLLTLQRRGQPPALAALVGLDGQEVTLWVEGRPRRLALAELATAWRGEFSTLWRAPPGYAERAVNAGPLREWLAGHLDPLTGSTVPASSAASPNWAELSPRIQAFQASQGLQPDGRVGPITLMQLNRTAGVSEPRLDPAR
jgi:general secretion pathway protein A